jgi:hypothetical protein
MMLKNKSQHLETTRIINNNVNFLIIQYQNMSTANKAKNANKKALLDDPVQATQVDPSHL